MIRVVTWIAYLNNLDLSQKRWIFCSCCIALYEEHWGVEEWSFLVDTAFSDTCYCGNHTKSWCYCSHNILNDVCHVFGWNALLILIFNHRIPSRNLLMHAHTLLAVWDASSGWVMRYGRQVVRWYGVGDNHTNRFLAKQYLMMSACSNRQDLGHEVIQNSMN